jgi:hypothetical protein
MADIDDLTVEDSKVIDLVPIERITDMKLVMDPEESLADASKAAKALMAMVEEQGLSIGFGGRGSKKHLMIEAWQTIAAWYGVTVGVDYCRSLDPEGESWEAKAIAVTPTGREISAIALCTRNEPNWEKKPDFQLASMAQTRACGKALRLCLGWVAVIAGYSATPAEEMEREAPPRPRQEPRATRQYQSERPVQAPGRPQRDETAGNGRMTYVQFSGLLEEAGKTGVDVAEVLGEQIGTFLNGNKGTYADIWELCKAAWAKESSDVDLSDTEQSQGAFDENN